ncbi:MAG: hypothetical protein KDK97_14930 [Verrucomicrobiales bacterium]|nr:hypothetical protein [Verrucomicrobiales bacterium]MCP5560196.1 hypothetical protein [Verrucomicrobiaceae bacterium]
MKPVPASIQNKIEITRTGLRMQDGLSFEEWQAMAPRFGAAMSSAAFVIGDWLVYGEDHFRSPSALPGLESQAGPRGRVSSEIYDEALRLTGLDRSTLLTYAYVARRVPAPLRNEQLSWEHHKAVAKLEPEDQEHWLDLALESGEGGAPVSTRRLRKSITIGHLLTPDEMTADVADRGQPNHIPFINRLWSWWTQMKESGWNTRATPEQKETLKRDLGVVLKIIREID